MLTWYAIETNPQCENRVYRGLKAQGHPVTKPAKAA